MSDPTHDVGFTGAAKKPTPKMRSPVKQRADKVQVGGRHYADLAIQPLYFCYKNGITSPETLAIKYLTRHRTKDGVTDLLKAMHCIKLLLLWEYQLDEKGLEKMEAVKLKKKGDK